MKYSPSFAIICALTVLAANTPAQTTQTKTDYFYVGDYLKSDLLGYKANVTSTGTTYTNYGLNGSSSTSLIGTGIKEGIDGTANTILAVEGGPGVDGKAIIRFDRTTGKQVTGAQGSITGFTNIGNFTISADAKYLYVADAGAGQLDMVNLATGKIVAHQAFAGAHDVTLSGDGKTAYVSNYSNGTATIEAYAINTTTGTLTDEGNFIKNYSKQANLTNLVGLTTDAKGNIWAEQNVRGVGESIFAFNSAGQEILDFKDTKTTGTMGFTFGTDFGVDGNLYIASLGSAYNSSYKGATSGIFEFNAAEALADWKSGTVETDQSLLSYVSITGNPLAAGPKYIKWGSNFSTSNDPGYTPVPEPASCLALGIGALGLLRKRKAAK